MRYLIAMLLALSISLSADLSAKHVKKSSGKAIHQAEAALSTDNLYRDHDFATEGGYGPAVKKQMKEYKAAVAAYKASWKVEDVTNASRLAFTTPAATWPFVNYSWHVIEGGGDVNEAETSLHSAEIILGTFDGKEADHIRKVMAGHRTAISDVKKALARVRANPADDVVEEAEEANNKADKTGKN